MTAILEELNKTVFCVRYVPHESGFVAQDVEAHRLYEGDNAMVDCMDVALPSMLHVKAHHAAHLDIEGGGDYSGEFSKSEYHVEHEGKMYTVNRIGGPSGEIVLHIFLDGEFVTHCDTGIML